MEREDGLLMCVFGSGYLAWWELNDILLVSKTFHRLITDAKQHLPDWAKMTSWLDSENTLNYCGYCQEKYDVCSCCEENVQFSCDIDPRMRPDYESLSSFNQFKLLLAFQQTCVSNLLQFYPADLSVECV